MKLLAFVTIALLSLGGCASLQPTSVNPSVTYITNDLKAVTAAAGGDCSITITAPSAVTLHTDCSPLDPTTTTVATNGSTYELCFGDAATSQLGGRVSAAALGLQAQLCAQAGKTVGATTAPAVTAPAPTPLAPTTH
jgi:hypothetical protein